MTIVVIAGLAVAAFLTRDRWKPWISAGTAPTETEPDEHEHGAVASESNVLKLSPQARENLGLVSKPIVVQSYWRSIQIPGVIVDRPGHTDRGVTAPAASVVVEIHAHPGDTVKPGDDLFTLRISSEYVQNSQSELFKATRETELLKEQYARLEELVKSKAVPGSRLIELDSQMRRQSAAIQALRQDLSVRGLSAAQIDEAAAGRFASTIKVVAPPATAAAEPAAEIKQTGALVEDTSSELAYEVQELKVDLGQQVQAGELLCYLANHSALYIEGHAFKQDAPYLEQTAQNGWSIQVEFADDDRRLWPSIEQGFPIHHMANSVDPAKRTFDFFVSLSNQSRTYEKDGKTFVVWRFRPGQRVRLHVPVEEFKDVIVLPAAAVVREGPEAYVFRQNGDLFDRRPVHVLHEDRLNMVIANDGSLSPGLYVAQSAAASLNRVLKAQSSSGVPAGMHVHADGTVHGAH
jgi:multidrug efflux pump subunit AcrA (membrane-fusion protein)